MPPEVQLLLEKILSCQALDAEQVQAAFTRVMQGDCSEVDVASLLTALRCHGETVAVLVGGARALRQAARRIVTRRTGLLDTCGTGGDGLQTFNISTAVAFVAAAAGVPVAKHGNRSATSRSGSADVLEALGCRLELTPEQMGLCLDELGITFCFAPCVHPAMRHVASVRRQLPFPTIFNLLGPLTNPAGVEYQLLGASGESRAQLLAETIRHLGTRQTFVVCGAGGEDEVSIAGVTQVWQVRSNEMRTMTWHPRPLGLETADISVLKVDSPQASAELILRVFRGERGPARDAVVLNAAAALLAAEHVPSLESGVALAQQILDTGQAERLLQLFVNKTRELQQMAE
ncbi:MAG: anthranilate phosphoribosyltransferase [Planctomycetaceae bacterium]|nr:MAG: anthranilate phosphoribosyltransferase [Planctomycetaceae bacterium]